MERDTAPKQQSSSEFPSDLLCLPPSRLMKPSLPPWRRRADVHLWHSSPKTGNWSDSEHHWMRTPEFPPTLLEYQLKSSTNDRHYDPKEGGIKLKSKNHLPGTLLWMTSWRKPLNHKLQDGLSDTNILEPGREAPILQTLWRAKLCHCVSKTLGDLLCGTGGRQTSQIGWLIILLHPLIGCFVLQCKALS